MEKSSNAKTIKMIIRIAVLVAAVLLIVTGIMTHGFEDVRHKAIMICLECIGIG